SWPTASSESCVGGGDPSDEAETARAKAVLSSPEIKLLAVSPPSERAEGPRRDAAIGLASGSCRGPRTRRTLTTGPQQPERPGALPRPSIGPAELPSLKTPGPRIGVGVRREQNIQHSAGIAGRAQEFDETGQQGSERPRSTGEAGEPVPRGPGGGKGGAASRPCGRETGRGHRASSPVHAAATDSAAVEGSRDVTSRMP